MRMHIYVDLYIYLTLRAIVYIYLTILRPFYCAHAHGMLAYLIIMIIIKMTQ